MFPSDGQCHKVFLPMDATPVTCTTSANAADKTECDWRWNKANVQSTGGGFNVRNGPTDAEQNLRRISRWRNRPIPRN